MLSFTADVYEVDETVGNAQVFGLGPTAPIALVREVLTYALAEEYGYRTAAALAADGYEFCPDGPAYYDGEGDPAAECWAWDWNRETVAPPAYKPTR